MLLSKIMPAIACLFVVATSARATDPPGLIVATSEPQASQPTGSIVVAEGRFVPLNMAPGKPALLLGNDAGYLTIYPLKPGEAVNGIRYDEPANAKTKRYTFPTGANYYAVANEIPATVGTAAVNLVAVVNGAATTDAPTVAGKLVVTLTASLPPPEPIPTPTPTPTPVPVPVTGKLFGWVLIEETGNPFPSRGAVLNAAIAWSKTNNVNYRTADKDVVDATGKPPADLVPYLSRAAGKVIPQLYLVTADGKLLYEGSVPAEGIVSVLTKFKGQ